MMLGITVLRRCLSLSVLALGLSACAIIVPPSDWDPNAPQGGRRCPMMMEDGGMKPSGKPCACRCKQKSGEVGAVVAPAKPAQTLKQQ